MKVTLKWKWVLVLLAGLILFAIFGVSGIAVSTLEGKKGHVVTIEENAQ